MDFKFSDIFKTDPHGLKRDKRYAYGKVVDVSGGEAEIDVGFTLPDGTEQHLFIPTAAGFNPDEDDMVAISYSSDSVHSAIASNVASSAITPDMIGTHQILDHTNASTYIDQPILTTSDVIHKSLKLTDLTSGRVPFVTTDDLLTDSANLLYDATTLTLKGTAATDLPTLSDELLSSAGWTVGSGWSGDFATGFTHTGGGGTATLTNSLSAVNGDRYIINLTVTGRTDGTVDLTFGGGTTVLIAATKTIYLMASNTNNLVITPTTTFDGTITISLKKYTTFVTPLIILKDSVGNTRSELRAVRSADSLFMGVNSGRSAIVSCVGTTAVGSNALASIINGYHTTAMGFSAGQYVVYGAVNAFFGAFAGQNTLSSYNTFVGASAGRYATQYGNTGIGYQAGLSITTGYNNTFFGRDAGNHASQKVDAVNSMALGNGTYTDASNQVVIGNTSVTATKLRGNITIGQGTTGVDYAITFDGQDNDGVLAWMEDEDYFKFSDDVMLPDSEAIKLGTGVDMDIYYDGTSGYIHTDLVAASDLNIDCGTDKTVVLSESVWDDLRITPGSFDRVGVSDPAIVVYAPGGGANTYLYEFQLDDIASFTIQLPHGYKQGTDITCHVHWTPGARGNEENGATVGWKVDYSWANIDGNFGALATVDLSDTCDGTDHKHLMTPSGTITGTSKEISSMLICNIKRTDTGTDDTWAGTASGQLPMILEIDFHYEIDTLGSRQVGIK